MEPKPARWWNRRLRWWEAAALYAAIILLFQMITAAFPDQAKAVSDVIRLPLLVAVIVFVVYRFWTLYLAKRLRRP